MSELLAISFDVQASPSISLKDRARVRAEGDFPFGWGFAWYPGDELAAVVIKDPTSSGDDPMIGVLRDWERFRSPLFVCHLRGAAKRITQRDAQPFTMSHAGRSFVFAHSGDLSGTYTEAFPLPDDAAYQPLGRTDSEHVFCWLLAELRARKLRSLGELEAKLLHGWLRRMSELGSANVLLADGQDLAVFCGARARSPIHWLRWLPPHSEARFESESLRLELAHPADPFRTALLFSTEPLSAEGWTAMEPDELLIVRRGALRYRSTREGSRAIAPASHPGRALPAALPDERVLEIVHETTYRYSEPVERSSHRFRLRPVQDARQELLAFELGTSVDGLQRDYEDVFGNWTTQLEIQVPFQEIEIRSRARVRVRAEDALQLRSPVRRHTIPLAWMPWQRQMMSAYLLPPELPESELRELNDFAMSFVERNDYALLETLLDVTDTLFRDFQYVPGSTQLWTTPFQVYETRRGVCQDFTNLMICLARLLGVPARYRMGYVFTGGRYANEMQSDASHAWVELYLPWVGWHGFDPTDGCQVNLDHVRVACGRNYLDATPTSGVLFRGGGLETLHVKVRVQEAPTEDGGATP
jgi:transglutaminase-like putative cysteine protease/predicted glutamine amidotransferase